MTPELYNKFIENTATPHEMRRVIDWLNEDPANQQKLNEMDKVFCVSIIHADTESTSSRKPLSFMPMRRICNYVAGIAALFAICFGTAHLMTESRINEWADQVTTLNVPAGQYLSLKLADGTTVWLNAGTRIEYPSVFAGDERRVTISGEAMFDVAHNDALPFIVETFACDVEVLGTKFNVVADKQSNIFSTSLLRGSVKVTNKLLSDEYYILKVNESVDLIDGRLSLSQIDGHEEFIWTKGLINFNGLTFRELMAKFEKSFGVEIIIASNHIPIINYNRGKVRISDGIESALSLLQLNSNFTYTRDLKNNTIIIK